MQIETLVVSSDKAEILRMRQQRVEQLENQVQQLSQQLHQLQTQLKGHTSQLEEALAEAGCRYPQETGDMLIPLTHKGDKKVTIAVEIKENNDNA